ncbi:uncharacterized protein CPUR_07750 [Claviceps purpurea 20.1]|uniref:Reverse transcriptase Ty1/copia-type domain-containing protein n=1 Tax=Claviceps purpurea (strain 20.1) TaxID=1111077 RepID=M1VY74_CLAP2|nr:uncharacterized protein CPUR_07750 [Claviceps purpurea 20.1]
MRVIRPLYGIPESGLHWFATYFRHHREKLRMTTSTYDPCLLLTEKGSDCFGIIGMQTDDTLGLSDRAFSEREETELRNADFDAKPKQILSTESPLIFNGCIIVKNDDDTITVKQKEQGKKLALIDVKDEETRKQKYVGHRARGAYIATICQPEASYDLSVAAQAQDPEPSDIIRLNRRLKWQIENVDRGLRYIPLDLGKAALYVFVDGSFANNKDLSSQLGYVVILGNETKHEATFRLRGNIITYSSTKSKRVTRSALASELYGMVQGADIAYAISTTLEAITGQLGIPNIPTTMCTDSFSLYECLVKLGTTKEKRLMIDIMALRQSYERRELYEIRWINGQDNVADAMTKDSPNKSLERFVEGNEVTVRIRP